MDSDGQTPLGLTLEAKDTTVFFLENKVLSTHHLITLMLCMSVYGRQLFLISDDLAWIHHRTCSRWQCVHLLGWSPTPTCFFHRRKEQRSDP
jgi:hypothetical protein